MNDSITYPNVWRRFAAIIYDSLLIIAVSIGYGSIGLAIQKLLSHQETLIVSGVLFQLGWVVVIIGFFCYFWMKAGQTLGMRAWKLKVVDKHSRQPPSLLQCLGRCLLSPIGLPLFIIGIVRKDKQCLHDQLTQTELLLIKPQ